MRLGDLDALRKNMEFICMGIMAGTEPYNAPLTEIDNAPTVNFIISPDYVTELQNINKELIKQIEELERPQGEWLEDSGNIACSQCHTIWLYRRTDFCPNCGAQMKTRTETD